MVGNLLGNTVQFIKFVYLMLLQVIHYYLVDDTIEVREVHQPNDGRDPFPVLICRQRLNKNRKDLPGT